MISGNRGLRPIGAAWFLMFSIAWSVGGMQSPAEPGTQEQVKPTGGVQQAVGQEKETLKEGSWIAVSMKNILGAGTDRIITVKRDGKQWQVSFCSLTYTRPGIQPRIVQTGPYPIQANAGVLEIKEEAGIVRQTFRFDGERLVTPALIRPDERTWMMLWTLPNRVANKPVEMVSFKTVWRCLDDYRKQATGKAQFWTGHADQNPRPDQLPLGQEYAFKTERDRAQRAWNVLHFYEGKRADGTPREEAQLFLGAAGEMRLAASPYYGQETVYTPLSPADKEALLNNF